MRVRYAGICGTDLHIARGHFDGRIAPGTVLGHEASGTVAAVGADVEGARRRRPRRRAPSRRVRHLPFLRPRPSADLRVPRGHRARPARLHAADVDGPVSCVLPLPLDLDLRSGALVEPLAVAVRDVRRGDVRVGDRVLVVGAGPVGVLIGLVCRAAGARRRHRRPRRAQDAPAQREPGLDGGHRGRPRDRTPTTTSRSRSPAARAGSTPQWPHPAPAARSSSSASTPSGGRSTSHRIYTHELSVLGARLHTRADFRAAIDLLARGAVDVDPLVSLVVAPTDVPDTVRRLEAGTGLIKVLVDSASPTVPTPSDRTATA